MRRLLTNSTLLSLPWFVLAAIWIVSSKQKPGDQDKESATKIKPGVMSEKQKEHSKLHDKNYTKGQGRRMKIHQVNVFTIFSPTCISH